MDDLISRQAAIDALKKFAYTDGYIDEAVEYVTDAIRVLPSVQPYTGEEIQKMQSIEQAQLEKAYNLGVEEGMKNVQRKTGKWIRHEPFDGEHRNCNKCIECSNCGTWFGADCYAETSYCPSCGAMMEEEQG